MLFGFGNFAVSVEPAPETFWAVFPACVADGFVWRVDFRESPGSGRESSPLERLCERCRRGGPDWLGSLICDDLLVPEFVDCRVPLRPLLPKSNLPISSCKVIELDLPLTAELERLEFTALRWAEGARWYDVP
ncbi:unnamed protein product [Periconia digitata]|uniref:Uncharacterized protein n=1 Tax=Periconia digitata TaxID=1303443 RepID=A0A9W4ULX5_9PLEO|nr:unnamed protein product [Periconia digitata]